MSEREHFVNKSRSAATRRSRASVPKCSQLYSASQLDYNVRIDTSPRVLVGHLPALAPSSRLFLHEQ